MVRFCSTERESVSLGIGGAELDGVSLTEAVVLVAADKGVKSKIALLAGIVSSRGEA